MVKANPSQAGVISIHRQDCEVLSAITHSVSQLTLPCLSTNGTFVNATESNLFQSIWRTHPAAAVSQRRRILPTTGHLLWSDGVGRLLLEVVVASLDEEDDVEMGERGGWAAGLLPHGAATLVPPNSNTSGSRPVVVFGSARSPSVLAQKLRSSLTAEEVEHESRSTSTPSFDGL